MRGETFLDGAGMARARRAMEEYSLGEAVQDRFLRRLVRALGERGEPYRLVYERSSYLPDDNYRVLKHVKEPLRYMFAYFDYPVVESHLYLAVFDEDVVRLVDEALRTPLLPGGRYRSTPLESLHVTFMVDLDEWPSPQERPGHPLYDGLDRRTLRYLDTPVSNARELFDVVNLEGLVEGFRF